MKLLLATLGVAAVAGQACVDWDSDGICNSDDSCPDDAKNDADGDGVCTQCCGLYLGPNGGNQGEYEVQVDLSGGAVAGDAISGVYTIKALVYVTEDWDGTERLLHARAWDSSGSVILAIGSDTAGATRGEWNWVDAEMDMGTEIPYRVSIYFGYPMKNTDGYALAAEMLLEDEDGKNWIPNDGMVMCGYGLHEGQFHGSSDSYGNIGVAENACDYDGFDEGHLFNCNDVDSDMICSPEDTCWSDENDDADGDNLCGDVDSCPDDPYDDIDGDGVCTQCCGIYLGPNGGNNGEYEVQVDLSGEAPAVEGEAISGVYTISARVYTTGDWDGTSQLLHARAWDSSGSVITAIGGDGGATVRDEWNWISAEVDMGDETPYRVSVYFGYPMQNDHGWVFLSDLLLTDESGFQWVPDGGYIECGYGIHEGEYHGSGDSYGNIGIAENACDFDGFDSDGVFKYLFNCNDMDSDGICTPEDSCQYDGNNDMDSDNLCTDDYDFQNLAFAVDANAASIADLKSQVSSISDDNGGAIDDLDNAVSDLDDAVGDIDAAIADLQLAPAITAAESFVGGFSIDDVNVVLGDNSASLGGIDNKIEGDQSTVGGGKANQIIANYATISGGNRHVVVSNYATVSGGYMNKASGKFATVTGGSRSVASGRHSFTAGSFAKAMGKSSGVLNAGSTECVAENDNEIVMCADAVTIVTPDGTVDLGDLARRALSQSPSQDDEMESMRQEIRELRALVESLLAKN